MPFSIRLSLGEDPPLVLVGWLEDGLNEHVPGGAAFARANDSEDSGLIVKSGPMLI